MLQFQCLSEASNSKLAGFVYYYLALEKYCASLGSNKNYIYKNKDPKGISSLKNVYQWLHISVKITMETFDIFIFVEYQMTAGTKTS